LNVTYCFFKLLPSLFRGDGEHPTFGSLARSFNIHVRRRLGLVSQSSHRNSTENPENWAFLTFLCAMGWAAFLAMQFKTANKINGFKPILYGMAVESFGSHSSDAFEGHRKIATRDSASESWLAGP
jgi:hypothetical protein